MRLSRPPALASAFAAVVLLAGCAAEPPVQRAAPSNAAECRWVYQEDARKSDRAARDAVGNGVGGMIGAVIGRGIVEAMNTRELGECYDRVGAPPAERLAGRGAKAGAVLAPPVIDPATGRPVAAAPAGNPAPANRRPYRGGPGGGVGFGPY